MGSVVAGRMGRVNRGTCSAAGGIVDDLDGGDVSRRSGMGSSARVKSQALELMGDLVG